LSWPAFNPEAIAVALYNQLLTANGTGAAQYVFNSTDRIGRTPENTPAANQPYMGLIQLGLTQVENQAQGLE